MSTDLDWEQLAQSEPYWAVLAAEDFKRENLDQQKKDYFFETGERQARRVLELLRDHAGAPPQFDTMLDFGCGVGRLLIPMARRCQRALGVDVSETMLRICAENVAAAGLENVQLVLGDDELSRVERPVDLITSFIVFQHIPQERGYILLDRLLRLLQPGGFGYIQLVYAIRSNALGGERSYAGIRYGYYQRDGAKLYRLAGRVKEGPAQVQMNTYSLNEVMCLFYDNHVTSSFVAHTDHAGHIGVEIFFKKDRR